MRGGEGCGSFIIYRLLGWSLSICFLCIEAVAGDRVIKVHHCYYLGGLLSGLGVGHGCLWRQFLREWVSDRSFSCWLGYG